MKTPKIVVCLLFSVFFASLLRSQSLVELAKKERERRAALKTRKAPVITNADLLKVKLTPAVEVAGEAIPPDSGSGPGEEALPPPPVTASGAETAEAAAVERIQEIPDVGRLELSETEFRAKLTELKTKVDDAQDLIDLLTLRMNALWQQFYNVDGTRQEQLKAQISETYEKLSKTQLEASKALKEYDDFVANARREGVPQIWIR
jgi:hypothetical protein